MTNGILEELNENIKKLISIFEVYPNPVGEVKGKTIVIRSDKLVTDGGSLKVEKAKQDEPKEEVQEATESTVETISDADLQKIVKQINETGEKGKLKEIKAYITKIGSPKITEVPQDKRPELVTFLERLL